MGSRRLNVQVRGALACFTRPELKVERVSYEVMTPSAARGVLEAILWKPAIRWRVHEIVVLQPIRWTSFRRNEVNSVASPSRTEPYLADEDRAQRSTVALRDVGYAISATFDWTDRRGPDDNETKFEEMFERRVAKGQHHHAPYLGCREFEAIVEPRSDAAAPAEPVSRPLGLMFYDFDYAAPERPRPMFFDARLTSGVLVVPPIEEVLRENGAPA